MSQLPLLCHPITGKGQRRLASFLEGPCIASCEGWQVLEAAREQAAHRSMRRQVLGVPSSSRLPLSARNAVVCRVVLFSHCHLFVDMSQQMLLTSTTDAWTHLGLVPVTVIQLTKHSVYQSCHKDLLIPTDRRAFTIVCNKEGGRTFNLYANKNVNQRIPKHCPQQKGIQH